MIPLARLPLACIASCLLLVSGCDAGTSSAIAPPLPQLERGDGRVAWQGVLPCADCEAIETQLELARAGDVRSYVLVETYLAADGGARFSEAGRWQRDGGLIRLQGDAGSVRAYALLADGGLQPRDPRGRRFAGRRDEALAPVTADATP